MSPLSKASYLEDCAGLYAIESSNDSAPRALVSCPWTMCAVDWAAGHTGTQQRLCYTSMAPLLASRDMVGSCGACAPSVHHCPFCKTLRCGPYQRSAAIESQTCFRRSRPLEAVFLVADTVLEHHVRLLRISVRQESAPWAEPGKACTDGSERNRRCFNGHSRHEQGVTYTPEILQCMTWPQGRACATFVIKQVNGCASARPARNHWLTQLFCVM